MKFRDLIEAKRNYDKNSKPLTKKGFEKLLVSGEHIQTDDEVGGNTLWYNSDKEWMLDMKVSTFDILYKKYIQNKEYLYDYTHNLTESKDKKLSYQDIVKKFDEIEDVIIQPDGKSIRVRGTKNNKFADFYETYSNKKIATEIFKKINNFVNIK